MSRRRDRSSAAHAARRARGGATAPGLLAPSATLYGRVLLLRRVRLRWWLRALYLEGAVVVGVVLYLADWASAWVIVALPVAIAAAVKVYDVALDAGGAGPGGTDRSG